MVRLPRVDGRAAGLIAMALILCGCPGASKESAQAAKQPPRAAGTRLNVLLVTIDTLRADHLGAYGYVRRTSPHIDALARRATLFEQAFTYWPKTRGSFVALMTGRRASQSGYSKTHPLLLEANHVLV